MVASPHALLSRLAVNRNASPPGRSCAKRLVTSPFCLSSSVAGFGVPPEEETRKSGARWFEKRMLPSSPQKPPRGFPPTSHKVTAAPPSIEIFLSFWSAKNAIHRLSGEKNGAAAPSVPESTVDLELSSSRMDRCAIPSELRET